MIRMDGRLAFRKRKKKGTSSSNSPVLTFIHRSFSLNRWNCRRTLRDRCQEKEWKRTDGKSPRSCQCRTASASEKAAQSAGPKQAVLENTNEPCRFSLHLLTLCRLVRWVTKVCTHSHLHTLSISSVQHYQPKRFFNSVCFTFMILDLREHLKNFVFQTVFQSKSQNIAWSSIRLV